MKFKTKLIARKLKQTYKSKLKKRWKIKPETIDYIYNELWIRMPIKANENFKKGDKVEVIVKKVSD